MEILERARGIKLLIMDCDGVLTDGRLFIGPAGEELKVFYVRDGQGLSYWHKAGGKSAIISGRDSPIVELRGRELGIEYFLQGREDKISAFRELLTLADVSAYEAAFVGDDVPDSEVFGLVGLAVAVGDAHEDAKNAAHYVTQNAGGRGAVREVIDMLLAARK